MGRTWLAVSIAAVGLTLAGTSPKAVADESTAAADEKQEAAIQTQLRRSPDLDNNRVEVDVDDGIAVLEGTVDSEREKKEAQRVAHVDGILGVNNRLEVRGAGK
jgi:osmotically-inducible protein OsmY